MAPPGSNRSASEDSGPSERVKKTRNRIPQSCQPCRKRKLKCDRQHPACENCIKRGDEDYCTYAEAPEDEKTRVLRTRLEYLEAQVREISSSLAAAESTRQPSDTTDEADMEIVEQFSKLKLGSKDDRAIYHGPNCRYGVISEYPEIFKKLGRNKKESCELPGELLDDELLVTGFPFTVLSTDYNLQVLLPERTLCDRLIVRYFECCNSLFTVIDSNVYWEQYSSVWSTTISPAKVHLAITFFMVSIAARSLNDGHELLPTISAEGQLGALRVSKRWKKYGQLALSQSNLMHRSNLSNIQALLLLCSLEDVDHVRWNLLGLLANMARIAGLYRNPDAFPQLDDKARILRRRLWSYIYILDHTEAIHYGYPPSIAVGTFDCEPLETPSTGPPDANNTFLYWMFKLHSAFSQCFPGVLGIQKRLSAVNENDKKIRDLLSQLPPELTIPPNYIPTIGESPLEIIRRYTIACIVQGHFITLHRPYRSISGSSEEAVMRAAYTLAQYQSHITALSATLEPFAWFIEEFLDAHLVRAVALLGSHFTREPDNPFAHTVVRQVAICTEQARLKSLRKRDYVITHRVLRAIQAALDEKQILPEPVEASPTNDLSPEGSSNGWGMDEVLTESEFKWDEYLVDMDLDTNQDAI